LQFYIDDGDNMFVLRNIIKPWLPLAVAVTVIFALIDLTVQQSIRSGANDPQIQMAEDIAQALASQQSIQTLLPAGQVDIATSLMPFIILFDSQGNPTDSNARLHGEIPNLPQGVIEYTRQQGQDRITWQPEPGVRNATVIVAVDQGRGGFVLAGRSLREVEIRESLLDLQVLAGWLAGLLATLFAFIVLEILAFTRSRV
jgi:hypothetical protein